MRTTTKLVKSVSLKYRHLKMGHIFLIWMMFNPFHVVRYIQRASKHYGCVLRCHLVTVWRVLTAAHFGQAMYVHFVGLIHKTVSVLMFWRELKQFACIQSQCHIKLGEQQLNSVCRPTLILIAGIVCRFIHSLQQTQDVQQMLV